MTPPEEPTSSVMLGVPCGGINPSALSSSSIGLSQSTDTPMHTSIQINAPESQQQQIPQSSHHLQGTIV